ncbi:gamma carbonic anhydrase family protein [Methanobacterium alcaliphilum]|uniref:gamma carbonic anhydrase family protein n=1 Tax=Methanobacterium alcaliphilum TaxID=392018 RepID=UPI00200B2606|nr:gamma carbonic anhydrase family protein [Methanobacterium alcaliphilum]MCK9151910.1 gamma carbonic anhydrase family protein [Methanobacterium alcaliphilum]
MNKKPFIHHTARIFPGAHIVGDVKLSENVSIWYNAVLRGDRDSIIVGKNSNVQDNCVIHSSQGYVVKLGKNVSVGHAAVLHGCEIEDNVLIGMNATILNGARIGKNSIVGAGALVSENKEFPNNSLILGLPAKLIRPLNEDQIKSIENNALRYVKLAENSLI